MSINELFGHESNEVTVSARQLSGTAELVRIADNIATNIIRSMEEQIDIYRDRIGESAKDAKAMNTLLDEFRPWGEIDEDSVLRNLDEKTVEGMLKSQQSKRSRCRGKAMTLDNYRSLISATIAEHILRELYDKPKNAGVHGRAARIVDYTPAQLEAYEEDQEALRREIRNIQSKKSIMKSKADFDESSEAWIALLRAEVMLKDLRHGGTGAVVEVDHTKEKLQEMLNGVDTENLKAADSKDLLNAIKSMLSNEQAADEPVEEDSADA